VDFTILKSNLKRLVIPYSVVTTASLIFTFNSAKAATIGDVVFQKQGILTHGMKNGYSLAELPKQAIHNLDIITGKIITLLDWFNNIPGSLPKLTADLLTFIYHFMAKVILQTPLFLFNNPYLKNTSLTFSLISITIVTLLTVFEAFMQMFKKDHTPFNKIIKRWAIVAGVSGFLPFMFETGFDYINKLSDAITKIGVLNGGNANGFIYNQTLGFFDTIIVILFDLASIALLIPVAFQSGKRWFDIMVLSCISPLALSTWIFDRHRNYFSMWWNKVKSISLVQLVYSVFILMMGIFIFSTQSIQGGIFTLIIKLLVVGGSLMRMMNPPSFVSRMTGDKSDMFDQYDEGRNTFKDAYNILTFKNFRPTQFFKKMTEDKVKKVAALRKKTGKRFVDDLL
jgi:hypothetical protein